MGTRIGRLSLAVGALAAVMGVAAPVFAESHGGGHASGGGGHGFSGGHAARAGGHGYAAGHMAHGLGYSGGARGLAGVQHFAPGNRYGGAAHGGNGYGGGYYRTHAMGGYWGGGYWRGGYWPRAYYGLGFAWFLPILPLAYATYWWDGIPYYYANDLYYTWNPAYEGYVATDPPPVADAGGGVAGPGAGPAPGPGPGPGAEAGPGAQVFMYPKNGQSEEQQSNDRRECQQWASSQAGQDGARADDYRRAMLACVEGRGYSAK
jgi:hypothetical protein